jgi:hypothetical protein
MKTIAIAILATSSIVASADAGFLGFAATVRASGSYVLVDVFATVSNASDKLLNVYNANITTTSAGGFRRTFNCTKNVGYALRLVGKL